MEERNSSQDLEGALFVEPEPREEEDNNEPFVHPEDGKAEQAVDVLMELLDYMAMDVDVEIREDAERIVLDVEGQDAGRVIGKKGQTLDALQFFVNKVVNRFPDGRRHVVVDSGDYRDRHDDGLVSMARRQAKRAVQNGRIITLEPMSARDRRVIHLSLAKFPGVATRSDGQGLDRRVQIIPARRRRPSAPQEDEG